MTRDLRRLLFGLAAITWLAIIASLYSINHKPFTPSQALTLVKACGQTAAAFALLSAAGGLGRRILPLQHSRPLTRLSLQGGLGMGLLSLAAFGVGMVRVHPFLAWVGLLALGLALRYSIHEWWKSWADLGVLWKEIDWLGKTLAAGVFLILLATWTVSLAPPLKFDALVYHLAIPRAYLTAGRVIPVPEMMFWGMPQTVEMLYTWSMALTGVETAPAFGWLGGMLSLAGLVGFLSDRYGTRAAWVSAAALLSGSTLASALGWGYVDWPALLFGLGFFVCLENWREENRESRVESREWPTDPTIFGRSSGFLVFAGLFAGMALGTKYTGGVLILAGGWVVGWSLRRAGLRRLISSLATFFVPAVVLSLPWWVRNSLATGNPFYPFFFPAGVVDAFRLSFYQLPPWGGWEEILLLPMRATLEGVEGSYGYSASIGPLLLGLAPLAWIGWSTRSPEERTSISTAAWISLVGLLVWAAASRFSGLLIQSRLYWAFFPALAALAAAGFQALDGMKLPGLRLGRVAGAFIGLIFFFSVLQTTTAALQQGAPQALLNLKSAGEYLSDNLGWYAPAAEAVKALPPDSRVLMLWEPRSLYCSPRCRPDEVLDRWISALRSGQSPAEILQNWRSQGFTHLLYNRFGADFIRQDDAHQDDGVPQENGGYTSNDWKSLEELLSQLPVFQDFGGSYRLYRLSP